MGPVVEPACVTPMTLLAFGGPDAGELEPGILVILPNGVRGGADIVDSLDKVSSGGSLSSVRTQYSKIVALVHRVLTLNESYADNVVELRQ